MNTVTRMFNPFYDFARRKLDLPPNLVDRFLQEGGTASLDNRTIVLRDVHGSIHRANIGIGHRNHGTKWVNDFNSRSVHEA